MKSNRYVLHIFNPETDFALGHGQQHFTPKSSIISLRKKWALLPEIWASNGDYILLLDEDVELNHEKDIVLNKKTNIVRLRELSTFDFSLINRVFPWGWNYDLCQLLRKRGVPLNLMPDMAELTVIRELAHRRNTIKFHQLCATPSSMCPIELTNAVDIINWCKSHPGGYLKAPWSSSGKGVFKVKKWEDKIVSNWITGTLQRQKSILAEPDWEQNIDFATEWIYTGGTAKFIGYSLFEVDEHSQYTRNLQLTQRYILNNLEQRGWNDEKLLIQKQALESILGEAYSGPLGVDSLYSKKYGFNLCVEINLRMTMGIVNLLRNKVISPETLYG